jgi:2-oxoglutarate ferredoxin oxidoreductase subunit gamma
LLQRKRTRAKSGAALQKLDRLNIRFSGNGGQGIISTGMLLGKAIAIGDGRNVSQSQSYGPEARGGATRADIIVSDGEIYFPACTMLDILIAFTYEAYERYAADTKSGGLVFADESAVDVLVGSARTIVIPFLRIAKEKFKRPVVANMLALGFLSTYTKVVSQNALRDVVADQFAGTKHARLNLKVLEEGFKLGTRHAKEEK